MAIPKTESDQAEIVAVRDHAPPSSPEWDTLIVPLKVVNLMELLSVTAEPYWRLSGLLGQIVCRLSMVQDGLVFSHKTTGELGQALGELQAELRKLNLKVSLQQLQRIGDAIRADRDLPVAMLERMTKDLLQRVSDELLSVHFLVMPQQFADLYAPAEPLFGPEVDAVFPAMSEDIAEAGKCLALARSTAAVFHLMRVMELSVQGLAARLGIDRSEQQNWQVLLDRVNAAIRKTPPADPRLSEAAANLYHVKVAWRNEVMHPKQTYTMEEAENVFRSVRTFVRSLVEILDSRRER